jgi:hypothetical protein
MEKLLIVLILVVVLYYLIKGSKNKETMENLEDTKHRLNYQYTVMGENVIYSRDYEKMYKIGKFYMIQKDQDKMMKFYQPIIDAYNYYDRLGEDPIFMSRKDLEKLHNLVQTDINSCIDKQLTCYDKNSCLDTNLVLPTIM